MPTDKTRPTLLLKVKNQRDAKSWAEFVSIYSPLVYSYARKRGLQDADAADLTQEVMVIAAEKLGGFHYDSARGSFRGWLLTVTLNRLRRSGNPRVSVGAGTGRSSMHESLMQQPLKEEFDEWDQEAARQAFQWAAKQIRAEFQPHTWQAFWKTAVEQESPDAVAKELNISTGMVYVAKSRIVARLREKVDYILREGE